MKNKSRLALAATALAVAILPSDSRAALAYTIDNAQTLLRFDTATPGTLTTVGNFSGATNFLDGIDFRPSNGLLYGYSFINNSVVIVNPSNAATTFVSNLGTASNTFDLGIDFNPAADRLRLVTTSDQNLRINVDLPVGTNTTVDTNLAYAVGDVSFGISPTINEVAYTNNDTNPATGTQLYYVDYGTDKLVTTSNPNGGVLNTVGSLGVNATAFLGFDIFTNPFTGVNTAFAILDVASVTGLYNINLATGAATLVGGVGSGLNSPAGLAIQTTAVPEPGSALAGAIALGLCVSGRRRRAKA